MKPLYRVASICALLFWGVAGHAAEPAAAAEELPQRSPPPPFGPYMSSRQFLPPLDASGQAIDEPAWEAWDRVHRPYAGPGRYWAAPGQPPARPESPPATGGAAVSR